MRGEGEGFPPIPPKLGHKTHSNQPWSKESRWSGSRTGNRQPQDRANPSQERGCPSLQRTWVASCLCSSACRSPHVAPSGFRTSHSVSPTSDPQESVWRLSLLPGCHPVDGCLGLRVHVWSQQPWLGGEGPEGAVSRTCSLEGGGRAGPDRTHTVTPLAHTSVGHLCSELLPKPSFLHGPRWVHVRVSP